MDFLGNLRENIETSKMEATEKNIISKESNEKFDKLMGDDNLKEQENSIKLDSVQIKDKFNKLFDMTSTIGKKDDYLDSTPISEKEATDVKQDINNQSSKLEGEGNQEPNYFAKREANSFYEFNGNTYETDDNGRTYKKNGIILPNIEYTVNGNVYLTDENGNKISCDSRPKYTEEGLRNMKEQKESGGEERLEDDEGGHIIARILGGAEGEENLVPMRRTINRGDYKRMENEIAKALREDKEANIHVDINYDENSSRPSKIDAKYTIDGRMTSCEFDNVEGSTALLDSLDNKISDEDFARLKQTINEMKEDGCVATITSVKVQYDENRNPVKITVGILDESTAMKSYKEYIPR